LWQETPRHPLYRVQTNDSAVIRKLTRRKSSELVGFGVNTYLRIFSMTYKSPKIAWRSLRRLTGQKVEKDASGDGFIAYIRTKMDVSHGDQVIE